MGKFEYNDSEIRGVGMNDCMNVGDRFYTSLTHF